MPSVTEIDTTIKALLKHAPALREAGVLQLGIDGVTVTLAPHVVEYEFDDAAVVEPEKPRNIWNDADLYGRPEGSKVPGITKEK